MEPEHSVPLEQFDRELVQLSFLPVHHSNKWHLDHNRPAAQSHQHKISMSGWHFSATKSAARSTDRDKIQSLNSKISQ